MKLHREQVEHIAELARLTLSDEEKELYREQLSAILAHFERLQELDTDAIPPTATAKNGATQAVRPKQLFRGVARTCSP